jgi:hypothetical protein
MVLIVSNKADQITNPTAKKTTDTKRILRFKTLFSVRIVLYDRIANNNSDVNHVSSSVSLNIGASGETIFKEGSGRGHLSTYTKDACKDSLTRSTMNNIPFIAEASNETPS